MRRLLLAFVLSAIAVMPYAARAQEQRDSGPRAVTLQGVVEHVDYASGAIYLHDARGRERAIMTSPSTTFLGSRSSGYEELSDIRAGARLTVEASRTDRQFDAVLIKIRDAR